jgi:Transcriptional Coactivator p15 (PC4)
VSYQPAPVTAPRIVHEFENGRQWVRASINLFRGGTFLDLRVWYEPPGQLGELRPSHKGLSIRVGNVDELEACVEAFKRALAPTNSSGRRRAQ